MDLCEHGKDDPSSCYDCWEEWSLQDSGECVMWPKCAAACGGHSNYDHRCQVCEGYVCRSCIRNDHYTLQTCHSCLRVLIRAAVESNGRH